MRQLLRRIVGEAVLVGTLATLPGGLLGAALTATLSRWLAGGGALAGAHWSWHRSAGRAAAG